MLSKRYGGWEMLSFYLNHSIYTIIDDSAIIMTNELEMLAARC